MSTGVIQPLTGDSLQPGGDPVSLLSIGPFSQIDPGDSIEVDFALVGGPDGSTIENRASDIQEHSRFAQRAYDRNYVIPVPPRRPRYVVVTRHNAIDVYLGRLARERDRSRPVRSPGLRGYRLYSRQTGSTLHAARRVRLSRRAARHHRLQHRLAAVRRDTIIDGAHLPLQLPINLRDGFKYYVAVTAYDLGSDEVESLESGISKNNRCWRFPVRPPTSERSATR
jgi:hypothetical protein